MRNYKRVQAIWIQRISSVSVKSLIILIIMVCLTPDVCFSKEKTENVNPLSNMALRVEKVFIPSEEWSETTKKNTMLTGYLFQPQGGGPHPALVAMHGCSGLFTSGNINVRFIDWGERLAGLGYVVVFPDSFTPRGQSSVCKEKSRKGFAAHKERVLDALGASRWLQNQPMVQKDQIGLLGWSNGGSTVLATIGSIDRIKGFEDFKVAIAFYPGCTGFTKKPGWQPRIPLTIFIGEADNWTPAASCKNLAALVASSEAKMDVITFSHAVHEFDHPNLPMKTRTGLAFTQDGQGEAKIGTDPEARAEVLKRVPAILEQYLH